MVTGTGTAVPDVPDEGEAEQPVMVQVNDGAPASATVTVTLTVTDCAWTGVDGKASNKAARPAITRRTALPPDCK
jgi:hypothetical protein